MEGSDPGLILVLSRDLPVGTDETHAEPRSRVIVPENIRSRCLEHIHCTNLRCRCKQHCCVTIVASRSLVTFLNIATHSTYNCLGSNTGTLLCCGYDSHLMYTFYGSTTSSIGETNVTNLHLKIIAFMSFIFLSHIWRRHILKYEGWNFNSDNYLFTTDTK